MALVAPPGLVVPIARSPRQFGLFSVVTPRPGRDRWENGVQWEALACDRATVEAVPDCGTSMVPPDPLPDAPLGQALPFAVRGWFRCSPTAFTEADAAARALAVLEAREEQAVESHLWSVVKADPDLVDYDGDADPAKALGLLEEALADSYGSRGVIHMSPYVATRMVGQQLLLARGASLTTILGTPVVAGSGYDGTGPAAGTSWMFGTPALLAYRSEAVEFSSSAGDRFSPGTNDITAVAHRTYVVGYDACPPQAVLLTEA